MPFPPKRSKGNPLFSNSKAASLSAAAPQNPDQKLRPKKKMNAPPFGKGASSIFAKSFMKK